MDSTDDTSFSAHGDGSDEDIPPVPDESNEPDDSDDLETADDAAEGKPAEFDGEDDEYPDDEDSDGLHARTDDDESLHEDEDVGLSDFESAGDDAQDEDDDDTDAAPPPPTAGTSSAATLKRSQVGNIIQGENISITGLAWGEVGQKEDDDRSLVDFAEPLPPKGLQPDFVSDDLGKYLDKLKKSA